jgi:hypothetical protein
MLQLEHQFGHLQEEVVEMKMRSGWLLMLLEILTSWEALEVPLSILARLR